MDPGCTLPALVVAVRSVAVRRTPVSVAFAAAVVLRIADRRMYADKQRRATV